VSVVHAHRRIVATPIAPAGFPHGGPAHAHRGGCGSPSAVEPAARGRAVSRARPGGGRQRAAGVRSDRGGRGDAAEAGRARAAVHGGRGVRHRPGRLRVARGVSDSSAPRPARVRRLRRGWGRAPRARARPPDPAPARPTGSSSGGSWTGARSRSRPRSAASAPRCASTSTSGATSFAPWRSGRARWGRASCRPPWAGDFSDHAVVGRTRIPGRAEVYWELPEGPFVYWRARITSVELLD